MIVFDRVVSSDPNFKKYWLLHSIEEPIIDEATKTSTIRRTDKGDSGKLVNQTLLPQASNAVIEKIGGPGHEFDVFGTNYPMTPERPDANSEEQGAWRIQLSPGTPEKEDLFLNVLQIMDGDKQPLPVQKLDAPALVGVQLADKAVLFSKSGKRQSGTVTFAVYSGSNESQFIVTDLEPGFWRIEHDGVVEFGTVTKEGNVLSFNGPAGTTYTLTSVPNITAPADATLTPDINVPTNKDVIVTINYPSDAVVKEYKVGTSGTWAPYTTPVIVSNNNTVFARGKNAVGNVSQITNYVVSNIDRTLPTGTVTYSPVSNQSVVATIIPSKPVTITNNGGLSSYTFYLDGSYTFEFVDAAGNQGTATATVNNIGLKSKAKPGTPILSNDNGYDTGLHDGNYKVTMNMWNGENGRIYKLYENDILIDTKVLNDRSPSAQSTVTSITYKQNGTYRYYAELTNAFGTTTSLTHVVTVTNAAPGKAVLSNDNWDGDGSFKVSMNMWWGTNGSTYNLYENGILIYTQALANHTPTAQSAATTLTNRTKGSYEYRAELINDAGATSSEKMIINVTK
ncbi:Heparin and heparin-sulfate lyase precursor [compost metagenome]